MKIEPRQVDAFLKKPDPKIRGVVIYGNDDGLIAERALVLARTVCEDLKDPFRVVDIGGDVLKGDPARLADEFGALSLMGGRRVIRVRPAGEETTAALENLVEATAGDALIVIEGGNLTPRSGLRTLAETEACLAALPCYMDNEAALEGLVESATRAQGLSVDPDALEWIVERLGGDRGQSRSEIGKLLLYKQGDGSKTVSLDDALAVLGDTAAIGIDNVVAATFDGELVALDRALDRVFAEGGNPVQLVRVLQRHADQLHLVAGHAAGFGGKGGGNLEGAMFKARGLPRGGPVRQRFERHLRAWPLARLSSALQVILRAEQDCKSTGYPDEAIARRLCLALASSARSARQRR
ncbi:MAG: DNA polymerase III subunit delta [Rhodospirillales bacterium]|nr:DNA polymerase III subunit delta [Rhodospirillales bacterium]